MIKEIFKNEFPSPPGGLIIVGLLVGVFEKLEVLEALVFPLLIVFDTPLQGTPILELLSTFLFPI